MGFFTIGNLLTLGIALLILVLFRQMDKNNRQMKRLRDYADTLKKDLASFMEEQEKAIKDYGIALNVERDAAKELMKRLRQLTEEELAGKAASMALIDSQVKSYEGSLGELDRMASRVQENMNRIRDEHDFVETTDKRLKEVKNQLDEVGSEVRDLHAQFERENTGALEKAMQSILADVKSTVSDLSAQAGTIERQVEDQRLEIDKIEQNRAAGIARDEEHIAQLLKTAVEQAAQRADKMEDAALKNLKEQAEERIRRLKTTEEERLKEYHENAKARVLDIQTLIKAIREEWQTERTAWEDKDNELRQERKTELLEFAAALQDSESRFAEIRAGIDQQIQEFSQQTSEALALNEALTLKTAEEMRQKALESTGAELEAYRRTQDAEFQRLSALANDAKNLDTELRQSMQEITGRIQESFSRFQEEAAELRQNEFNTFANSASALKKEIADIEKEFAALKDTAYHSVSQNLKSFEDSFSADLSKRISEIDQRFAALQGDIESRFVETGKAAEEMKQKALESTGAALEEYRRTQDAEFRRLLTLADDAKNLDAELRKSMQAATGKVQEDFSRFQLESASAQQAEFEKFSGSSSELKKEIEKIEKELAALKDTACDNVSQSLKHFEDGFLADLSRRSGEIDQKFVAWQGNLETRLAAMGEDAMKNSNELLKAEIGNQSLKAAETIKQYQQDLDDKFRQMSDYIQTRNGEISSLMDASRAGFAEAREDLAGKIRELDNSIEDARKRVKEAQAENEGRIATVRSSVEETERHIREAIDQAKLVDKADALRLDLGRRIEDLKTDIERLDQRRAEAFQLENDFIKIKRLEDDVNAKMTRFISEKHKIETMEADFNRLIKISQSVEEKLTQITASDDTLQGMQLQLRKLEEALGTTEDKFLRIERKNQVLDNTNDGIDRNFKVLQESEKITEKIGGELDRYAEDLSVLKISIEKLAGESEKAREAVDKIDALDKLLEEIEDRTTAMQRARQLVAEAETRLEKLNKDAQIQARAIDTIIKGKKSGSLPDLGPGAPPVQKKENIISLAKQGWKVEEIAQALKISRGEVELTLDTAPRD